MLIRPNHEAANKETKSDWLQSPSKKILFTEIIQSFQYQLRHFLSILGEGLLCQAVPPAKRTDVWNLMLLVKY